MNASATPLCRRCHRDLCAPCLLHLLGGVQAGQFHRKGFAERQHLRALAKHEAAHLLPHGGQSTLGLGHGVLFEQGDGPQRLDKAVAIHADLGGGGLVVSKPHVHPHAIRSAPIGRRLSGVLTAALRDEACAVDAHLDLVRGLLERVVVPLDAVNLLAERVELGPVALVDEQLEFVIGRAGNDGVLDEFDLSLIQIPCYLYCTFGHVCSSLMIVSTLNW